MRFTVKDILAMEVSLALGCTEPVAIALGAAAADKTILKIMLEKQLTRNKNSEENG